MSRSLSRQGGRAGAVLFAYLVVLLFLYAVRPGSTGVVLTVLALPLAVAASALGTVGSLALGGLTGLLALNFLSVNYLSWAPLLMVVYMAVGAGMGLLVQGLRSPAEPTSQAQDSSWQRAFNVLQWLDREGRVLLGNERSKQLLGQPSSVYDYVHPEDKERIKEALERAYARGEARWMMRVVGPERRVLPVEANLVRTGERLALELRDLSEVFALERRLSETEARYRVLIEDAIDALDTGIVMMDQNRRVIWANRALAQVFQLDREALVGQELTGVLERAQALFADAEDLRRVAQASEERLTFALRNGGGGREGRGLRTFAYRSIPIATERYKGGRIDYYFDITEIKQLEERLREKTKSLEASNEKLKIFSHAVSHGLKEPLRTLEMFSGFLLEDYAERLDEEGKEHLERISRASARLRELIDDVLTLSSIGREPRERVAVGEVFQEVRADLGAILEGVRLTAPPPERFPTVEANRTRLAELLSNLISNAVKYNDKVDKQVEVGWQERDGEVLFYVKDNGIGIEEPYLEKVFEIFQRLHGHRYEGTGAGLAICRRIVEEYGGKIWAESEVGVGSTFYFTLPTPKRGG